MHPTGKYVSYLFARSLSSVEVTDLSQCSCQVVAVGRVRGVTLHSLHCEEENTKHSALEGLSQYSTYYAERILRTRCIREATLDGLHCDENTQGTARWIKSRRMFSMCSEHLPRNTRQVQTDM